MDTARSPFTLEPFGAYERYCASADTGEWSHMLTPGAEGFGLLVCFYQPDIYCNPASGYHATFNRGGPLLLPAMVTWKSCVMENGMVSADLDFCPDEGYGEGLIVPPVAITDIDTLDDDGDDTSPMQVVNMLNDDATVMWGESFHVDGVGASRGIVAPWQVMPISGAAYAEAKEVFRRSANVRDTWTLTYAPCQLAELDWMYGDKGGLEEGEWSPYAEDHGEEFCHYTDGHGYCACGRRPTIAQVMFGLVDACLTGQEFLPEWMADTWQYALERYYAGWTHIAQLIDNDPEGDPWSTSSWRRLSPFSGWGSRSALTAPPCRASTTSPTLPASSAVSSEQLTLFAA